MSESEEEVPVLGFHPPVIACGGGGDIPLNTIAALRKTRDEGLFWISLDVKLTQDGVPVLLRHDDLSLVIDGEGLIHERNWSDVRLLTLGPKGGEAFAGERIPSLTEAMNVVIERGLFPVLWLRPSLGRSRVTTMVSLIEMAKIWPDQNDSPMIVSSDVDSLVVAAQLLPQWPRGLFFESWQDEWHEQVQRVGASAVGMSHETLTHERIQSFRALDLPVLAYDVTCPERAKGLLASGVTAIFSDKAREVLAQVR